MVLAMNIGNTNFTLGVKKNGRINAARHPVELIKSRDDFEHIISHSIAEMGITKEDITGAVLSSVNPRLTSCLESMVRDTFSVTPLTVNTSMNMKLDLSLYDTSLIGSDRICICEAAVSHHNLPAIIFDFGTGTTINVIDSEGRFIGGSILPGLMMGINALAKDTALLPQGGLPSESAMLGRNTQECIASGATYGNAAMLDGMAARTMELLGEKACVIVTGGNANYIVPLCRTEIIHTPELLIEGLYCLFKCN